MNNGFLKVAAGVPCIQIVDCDKNAQVIIDLIKQANTQNAEVIALPELCICGYTCADLFTQPYFIQKCENAVNEVIKSTKTVHSLNIIGAPVEVDGRLYNCAIVFQSGKILGIVPKSFLPNYNEFYEARWFSEASNLKSSSIEYCHQTVAIGCELLFEAGDAVVGIELCEDLWTPIPPSSLHSVAGANVIINLSASNEMVGKNEYRKSLVCQQSARTISAYIYASAGEGESTTDLVFGGSCLIAENGNLIAENKRFSREPQLTICDIDIDKLQSQRIKTTTFRTNIPLPTYRKIKFELKENNFQINRTFNPHPFIPNDNRCLSERCEEIFNIQTSGLAKRFVASWSKTAIIGISGGLDSTLALLVTVGAMDRLGLSHDKIIGVTMPGFGTTGRTYNNAIGLMKALGVTIREIKIDKACLQHFSDIGLDPNDRSVTYENSQARERTQILMDLANKENGMVVGTGDLSELALGWATYNGDHMSMYGVNGSVPKTLVKYLVNWTANEPEYASAKEILLDIVDTPISPELLPADEQGNITQKTEDLVGPYELHDFFLYNFVRFGYAPKRLFMMAQSAFKGVYDDDTILKWLQTFLRRFFNQQFKRSALPDGPKVGSVSLSPRGDWRMPSDCNSEMWRKELE